MESCSWHASLHWGEETLGPRGHTLLFHPRARALLLEHILGTCHPLQNFIPPLGLSPVLVLWRADCAHGVRTPNPRWPRAAVWGGEQHLEVHTVVTTGMCRRRCGVGWSQGGRRREAGHGLGPQAALHDLHFWQIRPRNLRILNVNPAL